MTGSRTIRRAIAAVISVLALGLTGAATSPVAADSTTNTGDDSVAIPVQWWSFEGLTPLDALNLALSRQARITDISLDAGTAHTVTGVMVSNTGAYASGWYFRDNMDPSALLNFAVSSSLRITKLITYDTPAGVRMTALLTPNTGARNRAWWFFDNSTTTSLLNFANSNSARVIDFRSYPVGATTQYSAVFLSNTGIDNKLWWFWTNLTPSVLASKLASENSRLISLQRQPDGTYNTVMVTNTGADAYAWKYFLGLTSMASVNALAEQYGMRPIHLERYGTPAGNRYDVVMIDNLPAESRRIAATVLPRILDRGGMPTANSGFYLKLVNGAVVHSLNASRLFDPATGVAALQNLAIMRQVQQGTVTLTTNVNRFNYPHSPSPSWMSPAARCPVARDEVTANAVAQSVNVLHDAMMATRDTRALRAITRRIGVTSLRQLATSAGLAHTNLVQAFVGCGVTGGQTTTTLVDLAHLYEGVANGSLLANTHGARDEFWQPMNGMVSAAAMTTMVHQEAAKLGKSSAVVTAFLSRFSMQSMLGQADVPCDDVALTCNGTVYKVVFLNSAGRAIVPFKSGSTVVRRTYVFGDYLTDLRTTWAVSDAYYRGWLDSTTVEMLRSTVRAALSTW